MTRLVFLRHFETRVEREAPVSAWGLGPNGEAALQEFCRERDFPDLDRVYTSPEPKARRPAEAIASEADVPLAVSDHLAEVDRSGEGFVEDHDAYVRLVERHLRHPTVPFDWEDRRAVRDRIRAFLKHVDTTQDRVLVVTHGMFLAILLASVSATDPVERWHDLEFGETIEADFQALAATIEH